MGLTFLKQNYIIHSFKNMGYKVSFRDSLVTRHGPNSRVHHHHHHHHSVQIHNTSSILYTHEHTASRPSLRPIQPPNQCVPGALPLWIKHTTHLRLVPRLRRRGAISPSPVRLMVRCLSR